MNSDLPIDPQRLEQELQQVGTSVLELASRCKGDITLLLAILRSLESVHRQIRVGLFQDSLPDNRRKLYFLLKDIEEEGGWPYIERMKIKDLLTKFVEDELIQPNKAQPDEETM